MPRKQSEKAQEGHKTRVQKLRENDPEFFHDIGSIGGNLTPTKYTSESGRNAANKRWQKYREEQNKLAKGDTDETSDISST